MEQAVKKTRFRYAILAAVFVNVVINYMDRTNISVAASIMSVDLHLSSVQLGLIFSAFGWTYAGLQINGTVGRTYQVQTSANMTNWSTAATVLLTASPYLWIDPNPTSGHQFYRAVMLP